MRRLGILIAVVGLLGSATGWATAPEHWPPKVNRGPVAPLSDEGRWLVDAEGRVVTLHGMNEVFKSPPHYPAADGFGADDAEFLAENGFKTVRLGVVFRALMPEPGRIDPAYIDGLARTVEDLAKQKIFVLLDFHQDGYGPKYNGGGFPDWMGIDDGLPNPPAEFPLYYVQNPAMQRAFESFWQNRPAVDGKGLQDHFVDGLLQVVKRFKGEPYVMGYELMNEPWPGAVWQPCVTGPAGCPDIEQSSLAPFHAKATKAVRKVTRKQPVYVEPFVLFNFGQTQTTLPGADTRNVLSFHSYALDAASEQAVVDNAVAAANRDRAPLVATEFGATMDVPTLQRLTGQMDTGIVSWMFWAYNENIVTDRDEPASLDTVRSVDVFKALVRPYPLAVTGTPTSMSFDPSSRVFDLTYSTRGPDGRRFRGRANVDTLVEVPALQYPDGYTVEVSGATVTSKPCAPLLTLRTKPRISGDKITVHITPGGDCA